MSFGSGWTRLFTYDALGRRVQVTADDGVNPPSVIRLFYDGWRAIEEQDDTGGTLATYVHGRYLDDVLSMRRDTDGDMIPEDLFFHKDEMANVFAVSDAAGLVAERYDYDDFGAPRYFNGAGLPIPGSAIGHPYLFAGRRYDEETACTTSTTTTSTRAPGASRRATPSGSRAIRGTWATATAMPGTTPGPVPIPGDCSTRNTRTAAAARRPTCGRPCSRPRTSSTRASSISGATATTSRTSTAMTRRRATGPCRTASAR